MNYDTWKSTDPRDLESHARANATCTECDAPFVLERDATGSLCDRCCSLRDALAEWDRTHAPKVPNDALPFRPRTR